MPVANMNSIDKTAAALVQSLQASEQEHAELRNTFARVQELLQQIRPDGQVCTTVRVALYLPINQACHITYEDSCLFLASWPRCCCHSLSESLSFICTLQLSSAVGILPVNFHMPFSTPTVTLKEEFDVIP